MNLSATKAIRGDRVQRGVQVRNCMARTATNVPDSNTTTDDISWNGAGAGTVVQMLCVMDPAAAQRVLAQSVASSRVDVPTGVDYLAVGGLTWHCDWLSSRRANGALAPFCVSERDVPM